MGLLENIKSVKQTDRECEDLTILASSEVDILADGILDYPDELLAQLDYVVASVHSGMSGPGDKLTARIIKAMDNPYVNCIGHPTGRLLNARAAMDLDMEAITKHAAATGTALEINSQPQRLDLKDIHIRLALQNKVKLSL